MKGSCDTLMSLRAYYLEKYSIFKFIEDFVLKIDFLNLNFNQDNENWDLILIIKAHFSYSMEWEIFQVKVLQKILKFIHFYHIIDLHNILFLLNSNHHYNQNFLHSSNLKSHFFAHFWNTNKFQIPHKLNMVYTSHNLQFF